MSVLVFGLNHRSTPVDLLEQLAVPQDRLGKAIHSLVGREHLAEAVVLSTCNRVEVYATVTRYHGAMADLRNFFAEWGGVPPEDFADLAYDFYDDRAAAHLFAVASGLDSMVVGERQIHLQVREAFKQAQEHGSTGRMLGALFRQALRVGKRVRDQTDVSRGGASMVDAGLEAAGRVLGAVHGRSVLIVGAGKMGGMAGTRVAGTAGSLRVMNRSEDRAERLADRVRGQALPLSDLDTALAESDLVITSTGSTHPLIAREDVEAAMRGRGERPLVLLDLAVPRDVDPGCAEVPGVTVLDVDRVRELSAVGASGAVVAEARRIVEEESESFGAWTRTMAVEPAIRALRARAEEIRQGELARASGKLAGLDDRQRATVEALTRSIVSTLLHQPTVRLKEVADKRGAELHLEALRELFDLDDPSEP